MRTLKYAILGLINRKPSTGYDITKEFNDALVEFWYAKHSQIYPELKKLTDEGLISYETVIQGEKLEKKLYTITESGKKDLQKWLAEDEPLEPTPKDIFRLKAYFCDEMDTDTLLKQFKSQLDKHTERLNYLKNSMEELLKEKDISKVPSSGFGDYIVLRGAIMRENAYVDWLFDCIKKITEGL
ncbi:MULTISPECIES: PadR family transcriptional regulator [Clostridium]|uniref:Predicted transcriptional regulator n=3 Tax=Clostridium TaxID=1485 RepID=D8GPF5_CLOLD|nr:MULTISPECIES: PadR family transcriptional regulator [Clostridium]ADK16033.1 predicted transcriptional regulator [Clostridium ljungdahlii DSM 13528]AGY75209.1 PadR family transcriptional regulator [Clostridium autoethanogenum DSM 10061]ALU35379.1 PadR family transcriptional regulator [Clostridium autoethanogenum DSM 10061]OAA87091.1 Transcriptional regulator PadR-like family protein [Clostridium ljungdahlii DSM 13528]OVY49542.1 Transcriptional regulator PadR-like family protein [Clostridium 